MPERITRIIGEVMKASASREKDEAAVDAVSARLLTEMEDFYLDDEISFTLLGNILLFNDFIRITGDDASVREFGGRLKEKGIKKFTVSRGVGQREFRDFLKALSEAGPSPESTANILVEGVRSFAPDEKSLEVPSVVARSVEKLGEQFEAAARGQLLDMAAIEQVAASLVAVHHREPNVMKLLAGQDGTHESRAGHAVNAGLLAVFLADALDLDGQMVQDVAVAGLLHDVGGLLLPEDVRGRGAALSKEEWDSMKRHPITGAMFLARHRHPPRVAVIVAFEHHMKFDGTGYPQTKWRGTLQSVASQIVAIADFCAALLVPSPRRRSLKVCEVAGLLRELSGRDFNPVLTTNFISRLKAVRAF